MIHTLVATQTDGVAEGVFAIGFFLTVIAIALAISLAIMIVICALLYNAQKAIPPEHRKIEPGLIWLLLIPLFNLIWNFQVFLKVPDSYKSHFDSRGRADVGDCGRGIGLWYSIAAACSIVPCVNYIAAPASLVLLIIFLVKMYGLKAQMSGGVSYAAGPPPAPPMH